MDVGGDSPFLSCSHKNDFSNGLKAVTWPRVPECCYSILLFHNSDPLQPNQNLDFVFQPASSGQWQSQNIRFVSHRFSAPRPNEALPFSQSRMNCASLMRQRLANSDFLSAIESSFQQRKHRSCCAMRVPALPSCSSNPP